METTTLPHPAQPAIHLKQILVPVDFSEPSEQALRYAVRFAEQLGAELTLLHIVQPAVAPYPDIAPYPDYTEEGLKNAKEALQTIAARPLLKAATVHAVVCTGLAAHEIVEAARELDADLIVIATHGYTGWKHFCIGSTTERVVRTAPCPVFVVREKQHELF